MSSTDREVNIKLTNRQLDYINNNHVLELKHDNITLFISKNR